MATLTAWKFGTWDGANQAIGTLEALSKQGLIKLHDAASVSWQPETRRPKTRQLRNFTGVGALGGMFWGMLFGMIFLMPLAGAAIGAASGAIAGSLADVGIDDDFIKSVKGKVTEGTSALFLLSENAVVERVAEAFKQLPPFELIASNLTAEQETKLKEAFGE